MELQKHLWILAGSTILLILLIVLNLILNKLQTSMTNAINQIVDPAQKVFALSSLESKIANIRYIMVAMGLILFYCVCDATWNLQK